MTEAALMHRLMTEFPELKPLLHEHLADQGNEMQPYLLMGVVAGWAHENSTQAPARVSQVTRWLDRQFGAGDAAIQDLIGVGFVEMLPEAPEGNAVLNLLGPKLREVAHDLDLLEPGTD